MNGHNHHPNGSRRRSITEKRDAERGDRDDADDPSNLHWWSAGADR
ncbi:hypothetical protein [Nocardia sp. bgisy134]